MADKLSITPQVVRVALAGIRDQIWQPLYDSQDFGDGDSMLGTFSFFSAPGGKSAAQTNLSQSAQLSSAVSMLVRGHAMRSQLADDADSIGTGTADGELLCLMMQYSAVQWVLTEKNFLKAPGEYVSGRIKVRGAEDFFQHMGAELCVPLMYDANVVEPIEALQQFRVDWTVFEPDCTAEATRLTDGLTTLDFLRVFYYMLGYRRRPAQ